LASQRDDIEEEYLNKMKTKSIASSSTASSFHSIRSKQKEQQKQAENEIETESETESDLEEYSTAQILKRIYQTNNTESNDLPMGGGMATGTAAQTGLDQYTLHPFVYLHPVIKPPLAEYTSITDCIDTSIIDRPASPNILGRVICCVNV
jgi:hypothetical protein